MHPAEASLLTEDYARPSGGWASGAGAGDHHLVGRAHGPGGLHRLGGAEEAHRAGPVTRPAYGVAQLTEQGRDVACAHGAPPLEMFLATELATRGRDRTTRPAASQHTPSPTVSSTGCTPSRPPVRGSARTRSPHGTGWSPRPGRSARRRDHPEPCGSRALGRELRRPVGARGGGIRRRALWVLPVWPAAPR
ncbi:hypothetical protein QJS66_10380 [Kocuria rhizophila]|nr:hypothetical protein QJS66_10380 [Kocuria rhizophila]